MKQLPLTDKGPIKQHDVWTTSYMLFLGHNHLQPLDWLEKCIICNEYVSQNLNLDLVGQDTAAPYDENTASLHITMSH